MCKRLIHSGDGDNVSGDKNVFQIFLNDLNEQFPNLDFLIPDSLENPTVSYLFENSLSVSDLMIDSFEAGFNLYIKYYLSQFDEEPSEMLLKGLKLYGEELIKIDRVSHYCRRIGLNFPKQFTNEEIFSNLKELKSETVSLFFKIGYLTSDIFIKACLISLFDMQKKLIYKKKKITFKRLKMTYLPC